MYKIVFILFILGHLIGDFFFQSEKLAEKKEQKSGWLLLHAAEYTAAMILVILPVYTSKALAGALLLSLFHFITDTAKYFLKAKYRRSGALSLKKERNIFAADQMLHLAAIAVVTYLLIYEQLCTGQPVFMENPEVRFMFTVSGFKETACLSWVTALLMTGKPANLCIQRLLAVYRPEEPNEKDTRAGRMIGTVERIIMLVFLAFSQYSALGFVLTAKSIARYDRISKDQNFAEYYLLGTLLSTLLVILISFLL